MSLINPNPGTCVDRQTILLLKIEAAKRAEIFAKPFADECNEIQSYLQKNWLLIAPKNLQDPYDKLFKQLQEVNGKLWILEDEIRDLKKQYETTELFDQSLIKARILEVALDIPALNDKRNNLIKQINELFGIQNSLEKLHKN